MAKFDKKNQWLNEALRDLFGNSLPQTTDQRQREAREKQESLEQSRKSQKDANRQQLVDILKRNFSAEAVPLVLEQIEKNKDPVGAARKWTDPRNFDARATLENQLDVILNRPAPMVIDPQEEKNRAKAQNKLDDLLGRKPPKVLRDEYEPTRPISKISLPEEGMGSDKAGELLQNLGNRDIEDPRKRTAASAVAGGLRVAGGDVTALPQLLMDASKMVEQKFQAVKDDAVQIAGAFKSVLSEQRAGKIVSKGFGEGLEGTGKLMEESGMGVPGTLVKELGKLSKAVGDNAENMRAWGKNLHESNMEFAEFSGGMAAVGARQMVRDILLSQQRGNRRAATAEYEASGKHELEKAFAPFEDLFANFQNRVAGRLDRGWANILNALNKKLGIDALNEAEAKKVGEMDKDANLLQNWLSKEANNEQDFSQYGRPRRHRRP